VVWPNYVKDHAYLFLNGDVEGDYDEGKLKHLHIHGAPREASANMTKCLEWAYDVVEKALEDFKE